MELTISKMTVEDLDLIAKNLNKDFDSFWTYSIFKSELENSNSKYIVAKQNSEIVGFAGIWIAIDVAHITNIVVKKDMRKKGIGSLLLQELINMCKKLKLNEITLEVSEKILLLYIYTKISVLSKLVYEKNIIKMEIMQ